jgi:hypothetical protein
MGEEFAVRILNQVPKLWDELRSVPETLASEYKIYAGENEIALLQQALLLAAHFNQVALAKELFLRLSNHLKKLNPANLYTSAQKIARSVVRGLRKLGLREELKKFIEQVYTQLVPKGDLAQARVSSGKDWPDALTALLAIAEAWEAMNLREQALPIFQEARNYLFDEKSAAQALKYTLVARSYVAALSQLPAAKMFERIAELFSRLAPLPNTQTPSPFYSRLHLLILEETIRTLIGENQAISPEVRRWLEDDEFLVRQRIHRDMQKALQ